MRTHIGVRLLALVTVLVSASVATAGPDDWEAFPVDRFRLAMDSEGILNVDWAGVPEHMAWNASVWVGTSHDPLVLSSPEDGQVGALVAQRVATGVGGTLALWHRLQVGVSAQLVVFQNDDNPEAIFSEQMDELTRTGLGDLRVSPKVRLLGGVDSRFHLAVIPAFTVPMGSAGDYLREDGPTAAPELAASGSFGAVRLSGNAGYTLRKRAGIADLVVDDELFARAGAAMQFGDPLSPAGEVALTLSGSTAARSPLSESNENSFEVLAGGARAFGDVHLFGAAGVGLSEGFGTPDWRVVAGTRVQFRRHDRDGDGLRDRDDTCPLHAEDRDGYEDSDGCPDSDNDGDGIADSADAAPNAPEDFDGFEDDDGAPDPDNDGDGIADADDQCPTEPETANDHQDDDGCPDENLAVLTGLVVDADDGSAIAGARVTSGAESTETDADGVFALRFAEGGEVEVEVEAMGYDPGAATARVSRGQQPTEITIEIAKPPPPGVIRGVIRSYRGTPVEATVRVEPAGLTEVTDAEGFFEITLPAGEYRVVVEAKGFRSQRRTVRVDENGVTVLNADLRKQRRRRR